MQIQQTEIAGCYIVEPKVFEDKRGYFFESYSHGKFEQFTGITSQFVQDNESFSTRGVLRGLHFQKGKHAQAKLVRVLDGEVLDVAVDIRPESKTFGKVVTTLLSAKNKKQMYVPRGCAHGFVTLSDTATFFYKCDNYYNAASEGGILYNDPAFNIDWILDEEDLIISEKDKVLPVFKEAIPH
ncbi:MAG: dTDP-4-dehydrorhamnose 3,5-epimerase [Bacteroidota bacterium]